MATADEPTGPASTLAGELSARLTAHQARAKEDPAANAYLGFAREVGRRLAGDALSADAIEGAVGMLAAEGFEARAQRLSRYLGPCDPEALSAALVRLLEPLAEGGFEAFAAAVNAVPFGVVLTAHPTFALSREASGVLLELATGLDGEGTPLGEAARAERLARARSLTPGPPDPLSLDVEHAWSVEALQNVHTAMETVYRTVLSIGRDRWPDRWTTLRPRLLSLATWVGFDQDGRTDVTWQVSYGKRLDLKRLALARRLALVQGLDQAVVAPLADLLGRALATVEGQVATLAQAQADKERLPAFARAMVEGRDAALVEAAPLLEVIDAALERAGEDGLRETLLVLRAGVETEGVSLARIHVRLNAGQLHNAVRRRVGLETAPTDPANRRTYFAGIDGLIGETQPTAFNFGDLADEPASAARLMMSVAQMRKFVDASTPVRFLIAETETGFTLLTALYFARLFGVEDHVEISPLFETPEAFERGEKVLEEALRSEHFRAYVVRQGRLAIEFGFSDSGRFIGQLAATFRIERLRARLATMLEEQGLGGVEVIFFNTHGESIGRGGHPGSLGDRFRYAAPPRSRADYAARGIAVREEDAFQGGEGYLPLLTPGAALATVAGALQSVLAPDAEADGDPIYDDPDFATEFFATVEQAFAGVVADPDYAALIGLFGTHLLPKTGSRPVQRQAGDGGGVRTLGSVSELRAIPNNALLHQLGYLANTLFGVGHAAAKDVETFRRMRRESPRFRRALEMAQAAAAASDLPVMRAYAATLDPGAWLDRAGGEANTGGFGPAASLAMAGVAERAGLGDRLRRFLRRLQAEDLDVQAALGSGETDDPRRDRLLLLHALRLTVMQRLCELAMAVPDFEPRGEVTAASLRERLVRLDVTGALETLRGVFPRRADAPTGGDFGEPSVYGADHPQGYAHEHAAVFDPIERLYALVLRLTAAIGQEVGAYG